MSYYLNYHHRLLPLHILKMMVDALVFSQLYALPVWSPSLKANLISRLQHLCKQVVRVTCGLCKFHHVSDSQHHLGWLPFNLLV